MCEEEEDVSTGGEDVLLEEEEDVSTEGEDVTTGGGEGVMEMPLQTNKS